MENVLRALNERDKKIKKNFRYGAKAKARKLVQESFTFFMGRQNFLTFEISVRSRSVFSKKILEPLSPLQPNVILERSLIARSWLRDSQNSYDFG